MNKVLFTKKHITISAGIAILFFVLILSVWFLGIAPKRAKLSDLRAQINTLNTEITAENTNLNQMKNLQDLLETDVVAEQPVFSNGLKLEEYFQHLKNLDETLSISIESVAFEDELIYPESEESSGAGAQNQLRNKRVGLEVLASNEEDLLKFIKSVENDERFLKIEQVTYRCNPDSIGEGNYAYSASIVMQMYYLSHYDTGKEIE